MPRDQFRILLQEHSRAEQQDMTGQIMSQVVMLPYDSNGELMPTAHVAINMPTGIIIVSHVPIAANNKELGHAAMGSPVRLRRSRTGRLEIIGLDKRAPGTVYNYTLNLSTMVTTSGNVSGFSAYPLTYIQLTSFTSIGYGQTPFGALGMFDPSGNLIAFV